MKPVLEGGPLENLKSLEAYILAAWAWFITQFPLMCHALYNVVLVLTQILTGLLVLCKVIEVMPTVIENVRKWKKEWFS